MDFLSAGTKKSGRCKVERWPLAEVRLYLCDIFVFLVSQIWKTAKQTSG